MSAQRPLRSYDFSYEGSKEVEMPEARASADVKGNRIIFKPPPTGAQNTTQQPVRLERDPVVLPLNDRNVTQLLDVLANDLVDFNNRKYSLRMTDLYSPELAFRSLKVLMYNFIERDEFQQKLTNIESGLLSFVQQKVEERKEELDALVSRSKGNENDVFPLTNFDTETNYDWEDYEIESSKNIIVLKSIYDEIKNYQRQVEFNTNHPGQSGYLTKFQPPFLPQMSNDEKIMIWNWIKAKEEALHAIYDDPIYKFAMMVAGFINYDEFGIEKLITSAHKQKVSNKYLASLPTSSVDELSQERDKLIIQLVSLRGDFERSQASDILKQQKVFNMIAQSIIEVDERDLEPIQELFRQKYGAREDEIPDENAEIATTKNSPASETTQRLEFYIKAMEGALKGASSLESRQRMLEAMKWMQQPDILGHGEMSPLFFSGIEGALLKVRHRCPNLSEVDTLEPYANSPNMDVRSSFAELVALQIMTTKFFSPTRVFLDKQGARIHHRETRLMHLIEKFDFDGEFVKSNLQTHRSNPALYAF